MGCISLIWLLAASALPAGEEAPRPPAIENEAVRWEITLRDRRMAASALANRLTGETVPLRGAGFAIRLAGGERITSRDARVTGVRDLLLAGRGHRPPGRRLVISMRFEEAGLRVRSEITSQSWRPDLRQIRPRSIEQHRRDSSTISRILRLRSGRRWREDGMPECEVISERALTVDLVFEAREKEAWIERYLEIRGPRAKVLAHVTLADWEIEGAAGPRDPGRTVGSLGYPSGCGQPVFVRDLFLGIAHPGAENFRTAGGVSCGIPAYEGLDPVRPVRTARFIAGAAHRGEGRRAFLRALYRMRPSPHRMIILVNDWYWKDKSRPLEDLKELAAVKGRTGVPIDSFTLDDGWSSYTDLRRGLWGALDESRFPRPWEELVAAGARADIGVSLWFGPIGGYGYRPRRIPLGRKLGYEIHGDRFCLAGTRYREDVEEVFGSWARRGMDYIKVDGFWPNCPEGDHGHPVGPGGAIAQMDALCDVFAAWRRARPDLAIAYTSGSHPSPFWLLHCDEVWRGGADDAHLGEGSPFDRYATFVDACLEDHRATEMPASAFVTFDLVARRILPADDATLRRGFWWAAARTSLHHDWYLHPRDLSDARWRMLAEAARWAKRHAGPFRFGRMIGGSVRGGEIYGFACFDGSAGTLALRNPSTGTRRLEGTLSRWLDLSEAEKEATFRLLPAFGRTGGLAGTRGAETPLRVELAGLEIAVLDVERETAGRTRATAARTRGAQGPQPPVGASQPRGLASVPHASKGSRGGGPPTKR